MRRSLWAILAALALLLTPAALAAPANTPAAVSWLRQQQQPDGGFAGLNGQTDPGTAADVAVALSAAGVDPNSVKSSGHSLLDFLLAGAAGYSGTTGGAAKLALAAEAANLDPRSFGGVDLIAKLQSAYDNGSGLYDQQIFVDALAILALRGDGQPVGGSALGALLSHQGADGGWAFDGSTDPGKSDSNTTASVLQVLAAAGAGSSEAARRALVYLASAQAPDGSFVYQPGQENPPVGDANSTALAIQALLATGQTASSPAVSKALAALGPFQNEDGAFFYRPDAKQDNLLATVQALPALAGWTYLSAHPGALPAVAPATGMAGGSGAVPWLALAAMIVLALGAWLRLRASSWSRAG